MKKNIHTANQTLLEAAMGMSLTETRHAEEVNWLKERHAEEVNGLKEKVAELSRVRLIQVFACQHSQYHSLCTCCMLRQLTSPAEKSGVYVSLSWNKIKFEHVERHVNRIWHMKRIVCSITGWMKLISYFFFMLMYIPIRYDFPGNKHKIYWGVLSTSVSCEIPLRNFLWHLFLYLYFCFQELEALRSRSLASMNTIAYLYCTASWLVVTTFMTLFFTCFWSTSVDPPPPPPHHPL